MNQGDPSGRPGHALQLVLEQHWSNDFSSMNTALRLLLTWLLLAPAILHGASSPARPAIGWQTEYDRLLNKYVVDGGVRYAAWKANAADMAAMDRVVAGIGVAEPEKLDAKAQLAFYINAYNAWTIKLILDRYPIKSVWSASPFFFLQKNIRVAGERMSLQHLEKDVIRKKFQDPRVHFAVNCGSTSCPPLQKSAYDARTIDRELEARTRAFTLNDSNVEKTADGKMRVSRVFKWYGEDLKGKEGAAEFIGKTRGERLPADAKVDYQKYDWSLNDRK
jgi:hypothetical protein